MEKLYEEQAANEKVFFIYTSALERGDLDTVQVFLAQAEQNPALERMILDLNELYAEEEAAQTDKGARVVQNLAATHLLSATSFVPGEEASEAEIPPLRVSDVLAQMQAEAALRTGKAGSQLIRSAKAVQDAEKKPTNIDRPESIWRVKNGVADLLIRQTGALLDSPFGIYHNQAKLPEELAKDLTVIGLYRRRIYDNPNIDYAMAVRILPEGRIEACIPSLNAGATKWLPYLTATGEVGRLFADKANASKELKLPAQILLEFLRTVLLSDNDKPTLVLAMADQWRSGVWTQLSNGQLHKNQLNLNNSKLSGINSIQTFAPLELPNLRILRLRQKGSLGETPQYVATFPNKTWQDAEATKLFGVATSFEDTLANSELFHYLSVTELPITGRGQKGASVASAKRDKGGDIPFKYQSVLEIVPFFLQKNDNSIEWTRIAHFLRKTPAWAGGGLLFPYPIHLAATAITDQLCMLE